MGNPEDLTMGLKLEEPGGGEESSSIGGLNFYNYGQRDLNPYVNDQNNLVMEFYTNEVLGESDTIELRYPSEYGWNTTGAAYQISVNSGENWELTGTRVNGPDGPSIEFQLPAGFEANPGDTLQLFLGLAKNPPLGDSYTFLARTSAEEAWAYFYAPVYDKTVRELAVTAGNDAAGAQQVPYTFAFGAPYKNNPVLVLRTGEVTIASSESYDTTVQLVFPLGYTMNPDLSAADVSVRLEGWEGERVIEPTRAAVSVGDGGERIVEVDIPSWEMPSLTPVEITLKESAGIVNPAVSGAYVLKAQLDDDMESAAYEIVLREAGEEPVDTTILDVKESETSLPLSSSGNEYTLQVPYASSGPVKVLVELNDARAVLTAVADEGTVARVTYGRESEGPVYSVQFDGLAEGRNTARVVVSGDPADPHEYLIVIERAVQPVDTTFLSVKESETYLPLSYSGNEYSLQVPYASSGPVKVLVELNDARAVLMAAADEGTVARVAYGRESEGPVYSVQFDGLAEGRNTARVVVSGDPADPHEYLIVIQRAVQPVDTTFLSVKESETYLPLSSSGNEYSLEVPYASSGPVKVLVELNDARAVLTAVADEGTVARVAYGRESEGPVYSVQFDGLAEGRNTARVVVSGDSADPHEYLIVIERAARPSSVPLNGTPYPLTAAHPVAVFAEGAVTLDFTGSTFSDGAYVKAWEEPSSAGSTGLKALSKVVRFEIFGVTAAAGQTAKLTLQAAIGKANKSAGVFANTGSGWIYQRSGLVSDGGAVLPLSAEPAGSMYGVFEADRTTVKMKLGKPAGGTRELTLTSEDGAEIYYQVDGLGYQPYNAAQKPLVKAGQKVTAYAKAVNRIDGEPRELTVPNIPVIGKAEDVLKELKNGQDFNGDGSFDGSDVVDYLNLIEPYRAKP
ncbi:hypothetical protein ACP26L_07570 [Paenibacillus sp. S-38]|uniref:hypothetical protein n=1 Tax=Paenibacillus sp. S-38 TaxID=3416710 RepID=UPI003CE6FB2B